MGLRRDARQPSVRLLRNIASVVKARVEWLEEDHEDTPRRLVRIVLRNHGRPLPARAAKLARQVMRQAANGPRYGMP